MKPPGLPKALLLLCGNPLVVSVFVCGCADSCELSHEKQRELVLLRFIIYVYERGGAGVKGLSERDSIGKRKNSGTDSETETDEKREAFFPTRLAASSLLLTCAFCCGSNYMGPRAEGVSSLSDLEDSQRSTYSWNRASLLQHGVRD